MLPFRASSDEVVLRLGWLSQQVQFRPQPYRQLAKVLRLQGHEALARQIAIAEEQAAPTTVPILGWIGKKLFGVFFGFGLSGVRALVTLAFTVALGAWGANYLQHDNLLVSNIAVVNPLIIETSRPAVAGVVRSTFPGGIPCTQISDLLYAADIVLPVVPLRQESQCDVGAVAAPFAENPPSRQKVSHWRLIKGVYSIVGKIVTTIALLTFTGVLKRSDTI